VARRFGSKLRLRNLLAFLLVLAALAATGYVMHLDLRVRSEFEGRRFRVTVSLGCAAARDATVLERAVNDELEALMRSADAALYEAKRLGRNRSVSAPVQSHAAAHD
jgi:GGDEF domain-containing protein